MPRSPRNITQRESAQEREARELREAGEAWRHAPGKVLRRPTPPEGIGPAGVRWWNTVWASDISAGWTDVDRLRVERGARIADQIASGDKVSAASASELRVLEDSMGLSPAGRRAQRIVTPEPGEAEAVVKKMTPLTAEERDSANAWRTELRAITGGAA